ncbi:MAG: hypothetical protein ABIN48_14410 [Ginsengibacter sp.]
MKPVISTFLIVLLSFAACLYFPWWSIAIVAFVVSALIHQKPVVSFLGGFFGIFLLWSILSFYISYNNEHILAHRVSLLILKNDSPFLLVLITGLIGGIVAGFAALTGSYIYRRERS